MRNPSRTLQTSIFEPLFAREELELPFQPTNPIQSDSSHWLPHSLSSPFSSAPPNPTKATMRRAAATIFNDDISQDSSSAKANQHVREREPVTCDHVIPGMHSPASGSSSTIPTSTSPSCPPSRSRSVIDYDDGSVASKLLTSITKSMSSPSLLACCKESARETPYQKTLRLREMKLQHCAEELGSESSDGSLCDGDYYNIFDSLRTMSSSFERSSQSTTEAHQKSEGNANSVMISVKSSPNLRCPSLAVSKHTSQIKERSFPPPLTHTFPKSTSSDSFSYSLRAYREDGRFVLKEVKVPCRQYFQSSRKDGRLTLQLLATDVDFESKHSEETNEESDKAGVYQATACVIPEKAKGGSNDKIEVESANTANLVGELEVCIGKENKKIDHLGMDNIDEKNDVEEEVGCLSANSLIMPTLSNGSCGSSKDDIVKAISHVTASSKIKPDFKAAKCAKTGKASRMRLSNQHLLSSSKERQTHIHPPGKSPKLKLGHDFDTTKFSQCQESLGLEIKSATNGGGKTLLQGFERTSASLQKSGYGVEKSASSTIIFKDVSAKCLMENVTKLVASFGLDGGKWSCGEEMKSRELEGNSLYNSDAVMESSMYNGIKSINIGVREIENGSHKAISGVSFDVKCERSFRCGGAVKESDCVDVAKSYLPSSSFHFDLQVPYSTNNQATFQGKEWQHTLHCKEILYRNQLAKGFMKLHCVA